MLWAFFNRLFLSNDIPRRIAFIQSISPAFIQRYQESSFQEIVRYAARYSPFYREEFQRRGIDAQRVRCPADLGDLYTTADDLRRRPIEEFLCAKPQLGFETTGTRSAERKKIYFSYAETERISRDGAIGLYVLGLRPEDRVVSSMDASFWNAAATTRDAVRAIGAFLIETSKIPPADFYKRVKEYQCNVMICEPSWLTRLTEIVTHQGTWPLKLILVAGENLTEQSRRYVESVWHAPVYMAYGQTETFGATGLECPVQAGYHFNAMHLLPEIYQPDHDGYGELVLTTFHRRVMPLIRYRTSDVTRLILERCRCPLATAPRIAKIRGRCDEMINCGMGNISPWVFETLLEGIHGLSSEWQAAVFREGNLDVVELRLELEGGGRPEQVEAQVQAYLQERFPEFWRNHLLGLFTWRITHVPPHSLRQKRKLLRVVDERVELTQAQLPA